MNNPGEEVSILRNLLNSYLYRDILAHSDLRKPEILDKLVQALALQVGSEVNYSEPGQTLSVDKNTVGRYIEILEKGYVVSARKTTILSVLDKESVKCKAGDD